MTTVTNKITPNQLIITINTSIPGYQKLYYSPSMTIPNINKEDKAVYFNPLIKYNKSKIDSVPEDLRKKQFFNKGLFQSLINYMNETEASSLLQATSNGYVNNNIKATLNTIFPENSVLYVSKKPYTIADVQWTLSDYKIDKKIQPQQLDSSKITDPSLYQTVVKDEIISGENQLESLPPELIYGANYTGPKNNTAFGVKPPPPSQVVTPPSQVVTPPSQVVTPPSQVVTPPSQVVTPPLKVVTTPPAIKSEPLAIKDEPLLKPEPLAIKDEPLLKPEPLAIKSEELEELELVEEEKLANFTVNQQLETSQNSTKINRFKAVFLQRDFYNLINTIYGEFSDEIKRLIQKTLLQSSTVSIKLDASSLSKLAYNESIKGMRIIKNTGEGNCFFIAVADGINNYNYNNQNNRIISGNKGTGTNLYTQLYLRGLVANYILNWSDLDDFLVNAVPARVDELNAKFIEQINGIKKALRDSGSSDDITSEQYLMIANDIFNNNDNFLVKDVETIPIDISNYETPFRRVTQGEIKKYILTSNFWANEIVIAALCSELKLNVIPLENKLNGEYLTMRIPFANLSGSKNWDKYLFLYYSQNHYELISFTQIINIRSRDKLGRETIKKIQKKKIVFKDNNDINEAVPVYILFTIFGSYYCSLSEEARDNFNFKINIMKTIDSIINRNIFQNSEEYDSFYRKFKTYFPESKMKVPTKGGAPIYPPYRNQYSPYRNPYPPYGNQYPAYKMIKKDESKDNSQIAYYITIDMEVRPGTSLTPEELKNAKCNSKFNSIKKAYSELIGKPYVITPIYTNISSKEKYITPNKKVKTKKINPYYAKGGNKNRTRKLI